VKEIHSYVIRCRVVAFVGLGVKQVHFDSGDNGALASVTTPVRAATILRRQPGGQRAEHCQREQKDCSFDWNATKRSFHIVLSRDTWIFLKAVEPASHTEDQAATAAARSWNLNIQQITFH